MSANRTVTVLRLSPLIVIDHPTLPRLQLWPGPVDSSKLDSRERESIGKHQFGKIGGTMTSENALNAVAVLDDLIRDPQSRQRFYEDPDATLRNAGADPDDVPPHVWQALTEMTPAELAAIAALGIALAEDGLLDGSHLWLHGV
jgi:hypothetical protein